MRANFTFDLITRAKIQNNCLRPNYECKFYLSLNSKNKIDSINVPELNIAFFPNVQATKRFIKALNQFTTENLPVKSWDEYS